MRNYLEKISKISFSRIFFILFSHAFHKKFASALHTLENTNQAFFSKFFQVSWIRKARHPVVLSSGTAVFTSDRRFQIQTLPDTWILKIDPVLEKDDGYYECQVNTRKTMSLVFKINVERKYRYFLILKNMKTRVWFYVSRIVVLVVMLSRLLNFLPFIQVLCLFPSTNSIYLYSLTITLPFHKSNCKIKQCLPVSFFIVRDKVFLSCLPLMVAKGIVGLDLR